MMAKIVTVAYCYVLSRFSLVGLIKTKTKGRHNPDSFDWKVVALEFKSDSTANCSRDNKTSAN